MACGPFGLCASPSQPSAGNPDAATAGSYVPFAGEKTTWHDGFDRYDYVMDESTLAIRPFKRDEDERFGVKGPPKGKRRCIVVAPKQAAPGYPWSWQGQYWDHEPQTEVELLRRGFHVVFVTPEPAGKPWEAWYAYLTEAHGLSKKPAFVGMSRGGVNAYDWSTSHPGQVSCIYADNPAIRPESFAKLDTLARNDVSLLNICGSLDFLLERHTLPIEARYHELGGRITVMIKDGAAHHPHSLRNPRPIADWIVGHMLPDSAEKSEFLTAAPAGPTIAAHAGHRTSPSAKRRPLHATCRGPGFTECYARYDARTGSPWGVRGMAVIAPSVAAPGKPWVFRADPIGRDAAVDQALLARGYHIVIPPLLAQSGPVRQQWDDTYKRLVDHGFSRKPVLEGTGTQAGEAYAWAVENPDKVACIYAENPALRSLMSKTPPIDNLAPLAKAGVPILHLCGSLDPWLEGQTRVVESRYKALGGPIQVIIKEGEGHHPTAPRDPKTDRRVHPGPSMIGRTEPRAAARRPANATSPPPRPGRVSVLSRATSGEGLEGVVELPAPLSHYFPDRHVPEECLRTGTRGRQAVAGLRRAARRSPPPPPD